MAKYLGLDVGTRTIGLAWSNGIIASPGSTLRFHDEDFSEALHQLITVIHTEKPEKIIFGYPLNMDGTISTTAMLVDYLIQGLLEMDPHLKDNQMVRIDERRTTKMARAIMHEAGIKNHKQKKKKDSLAAQLILEQYLATISHQGAN